MSTYQVRSLEEADQIIREHERKTKTTYALLRSTKNFGCVDVPACANDENEVRFETVGVPYCGVPFFVAGLKILQCQSYRGRGGRKKKEIKIELTGSGAGVIGEAGVGDTGGDEDDPLQTKPMVKKKKKAGRAHKVGCTATIIMKEVIYYPEFQLFEHSKNNRIAVARQLKDALKTKAPVQKDRIIYVTVPAMSDHFGHSVGLGAKRLFVKNDFYGHNEPGSSKRVYYPVKQEKLNVAQLTKRMKVDEDDTEARAKEVREILQSIMGLTYKQPGTTEAYRELYKDLMQAKLKYQQTMDSLLGGAHVSQIHVVDGLVGQNGDNQDASQTEGNEDSWPVPRTAVVTTTAEPTATLPPVSSVTTTTTIAAAPQVQQNPTVATTATTTADGNNQETSIFIEAMEAILNSQM
ncbi:putative Amyotrophic lateral sclerosis 2 chromosomal region candidate 8-containing protein 3 [Homarus americanus]|uniref:Putative Amyotrophic lateral sclerosis 2 chromosomal region candidate 8-containing protein 3 n=1 Tax=Homarus americanus TaxID=6706 RepID=A0A8J5J8A8_HOMAM|nr:putative Amyotrophic lateral sclerosis 2 chromosomal region candidate 8-containing protein 3 [Homarus americanus]